MLLLQSSEWVWQKCHMTSIGAWDSQLFVDKVSWLAFDNVFHGGS